MAGPAETVTVELSPELLKAIGVMAKQRGVDANTVLQQAIVTEKFLDNEIRAGGKVLVEKPDRTFRLVTFNHR